MGARGARWRHPPLFRRRSTPDDTRTGLDGRSNPRKTETNTMTITCRAVDRIDLPTQRTITPEGFLTARARIARTGIYQYKARELGLPGLDGDTVLRVLRPDDEVFHPDAMRSFDGVALANNHPPENVSSKLWRRMVAEGRVIGDVREIGRDDTPGPGGVKYLTAKLTVRDDKAITAIVDGKAQLSCGYIFDADMTPGEFKGQKYDLVQRKIRGNHVAVVDSARGGP
ncbi:MAG TPA: DUF2213 domain-containing protein, partial [Polyangia bacterium]|nr:DUF2213 domain-containing protein [Polyangia bacterium]